MKSKLIALAMLVMAAAFASAQDLIPDQNKKGKWGFVDDSGKKVIDYKYETVYAFVDGRAKVQKGDKWGYIGTDGKEIIKIQYSEMGTWANGRCKVAQGGSIKDGTLKGAKWGYITKDGREALKIEYDEIGAFEDGLAYIVKGGKYGYIDEDLDFVIQPLYSGIGKFNEKGYAWISQGGKVTGNKVVGGKMGIIKRNGTVIIKPEYARIGTFTDVIMEANPMLPLMAKRQQMADMLKKTNKGGGFASGLMNAMSFGLRPKVSDEVKEKVEKAEKANKAAAEQIERENADELPLLVAETEPYDLRGYKMIVPELFTTLDMSKTRYFAVSKQMVANEFNGQWLIATHSLDKVGIIDDGGNVILKPGQYNNAFLPSEGMIPVAKTSGKGIQVNYVNESGKLLLKKWLDASCVTPFVNGTAVITDVMGQYLIDKSGNVISEKYQLIIPQKEGGFVVKSDVGYGIIDNKGNESLKPDWKMILPAHEGMHCALKSDDEKYGYINSTGEYVIEPTFDAARSFNNKTACVMRNDAWGIITPDGKNLVECKWQDILPISTHTPNSCWVKGDDKWFHMDIPTAKPLFDGTYFGAYNFNENGHALVFSEENLCGYIDNTGNLILPMRFTSVELADKCLQQMKNDNKTFITEIEAHRFNLNNNPASNNFRLSHTLDNSMWEY